MKAIHTLSLAVLLSSYGLVFADSNGMKDMKDKGMNCMDMKGMDMKSKDHEKCMAMMHGDGNKNSAAKEGATHKATAVVKSADPDKGTVTLTHEPVKTLNWPAMTMNFLVKDPALFSKLSTKKNVDVEFVKNGSDYVVTAVK